MHTATPGKRTFTAGAVFMVIGGLTHSLAALNAVFAEPQNKAEAAYRQAAKDFTMTMGPVSPSAWDGTQLLNISYSILMIQAGAINLLARRSVTHYDRLRPLTTINVIANALMLAVALAYQFPPAIFFSGIIFACFAASRFQQKKSS